MKFLIAGLGSIGRRHLRNLISLGEKDIILFRTNRSTLDLDEFSNLETFTDLNSALDQKPEAVIISNPTALHLDAAIPAAKAGCAILMEKPVSYNFDGIDELKKALWSSESNLVMGFQFRYHPTLRKVVEWFKAGEIGKPLSFFCQWGEYLPDWHPWEDYRQSYAARADLGGGVVRTLCHPLDYLGWIFGEASVRWAFTGKNSPLEIDVEDMAAIHLGYENGVEGSLMLDYFRRPPLHMLEISGSEGSIEWKNNTGAARIFRASSDGWETALPPEGFERNDLFLEELRHFIRVARGEENSHCTLEDGIRTQKLVQEIYDMAGTNGRRI
jgi:predicted dehydrogenase